MLKDSENADRWLAALSSSMLNSQTVEMVLNLVISLKFWNLGGNELVSQKFCFQHTVCYIPYVTSVIKIDIYNFSDLHLNDQKRTLRILVGLRGVRKLYVLMH